MCTSQCVICTTIRSAMIRIVVNQLVPTERLFVYTAASRSLVDRRRCARPAVFGRLTYSHQLVFQTPVPRSLHGACLRVVNVSPQPTAAAAAASSVRCRIPPPLIDRCPVGFRFVVVTHVGEDLFIYSFAYIFFFFTAAPPPWRPRDRSMLFEYIGGHVVGPMLPHGVGRRRPG